MEVEICVDAGTDMKVVEKEYPDLDQDGDDGTRFFLGRSSNDPLTDDNGKEIEWLDYDEAVECCGFVEGAIPGASVLIEGNGGWAQSMISRKDFAGLAISKIEKRAYKQTSDRFWAAFKRGQDAGKKTSRKQRS